MTPDSHAPLRRTIYGLLIVVAGTVCLARVVGAENVYEPSRYKPTKPDSYGADRDADEIPERTWPKERPEPAPWFSSNDKSRWATIRALVDEGTYVIGHRDNFQAEKGYVDHGIIFEDAFQSLDKVMNPETGEFYSSKPPLFPTLLAGEYWALKKVLGWSIVHDRWLVVPAILITVNVLPFVIYLWLLAHLVEIFGKSDFGRVFVFTAAAFATYVTTFSVTLNNHTPAICTTLFAIYPLLRAYGTDRRETLAELALSGFMAGFTITLELPSAALAAALLIPLLVARPARALLAFLPAFLLPIAALFACNYAALGKILPAYSDFGGPWYNFPGSHWAKLELARAGIKQSGIDFAQESTPVYLFHLTLGHHGWFSLTPIWLMSLAGMLASLGSAIRDLPRLWRRPLICTVWTFPLVLAMSLVVSFVVLAFFTYKTNNYGGFTSGLRWLFWLTPLWLLALLPAADFLGRFRVGRALAGLLLAFSVLSVFYPAWNPWRAPWILQLAERQNWVRYSIGVPPTPAVR